MSDLDGQRRKRPGNRTRIDQIKNEMDQDVLRTRIMAVIIKHHTACDDTVDGTWTQCECDAGWRREDEWAVHVADAVMKELEPELNPRRPTFNNTTLSP